MNLLKKIWKRLRLMVSTKSSRRRKWPVAPQLTSVHLKNARLLEHRNQILQEIPTGGICAEVGIWKCDFSKKILAAVKPDTLHLIDIDPKSIEIANRVFRQQIENGQVKVHQDDSSRFLNSMEKNRFDWIYIDGDHSYDGVRKDLRAADKVLKPKGLISLNDYIYFGSSDLTKYGVIEAVNKFCIDRDYEIIHFALHGRMYNDVTLRRINS